MAFDRSTARVIASVTPLGKPRRIPFLARHQMAVEQVERDIARRGSSIGFLRQVAADPRLAKQHPFATAGSVIGAPFEAFESIPANIGLGVQQRKPFQRIASDVIAGVHGERPAQLGDVARASALPVISSKPVASTTGLLASAGAGLLSKTGRKMATRISEEVIGHARGVASMTTVSSRARFAQRASRIPEEAREVLSTRFGTQIDEAAAKQVADPSLLFDLQEVGQTLQPVKRHLSVGAKHTASDVALTLVEDPSIGVGIGIEEARLVKAAIQRSPEINRATEAGRQLRKARDLIRTQEIEKLGLGETFKEYRTGMEAYRQVAPRMERLGISAPVSSGVRSLTESERTRKSLEHLAKVAGRSQKFSEVLGAARTVGVGRAAVRALPWVVIPAVSSAAYLFGKRQGKGGG